MLGEGERIVGASMTLSTSITASAAAETSAAAASPVATVKLKRSACGAGWAAEH